MQCLWSEAFRFVQGNMVIEALAQTQSMYIIIFFFFVAMWIALAHMMTTRPKKVGQVHLNP